MRKLSHPSSSSMASKIVLKQQTDVNTQSQGSAGLSRSTQDMGRTVGRREGGERRVFLLNMLNNNFFSILWGYSWAADVTMGCWMGSRRWASDPEVAPDANLVSRTARSSLWLTCLLTSGGGDLSLSRPAGAAAALPREENEHPLPCTFALSVKIVSNWYCVDFYSGVLNPGLLVDILSSCSMQNQNIILSLPPSRDPNITKSSICIKDVSAST